MFGTVSMRERTNPGFVLALYARSTSAVSPEGAQVSRAARAVLQARTGPQSLFRAKAEALSELAAVTDEVFVDDDQAAVTPWVFENAEQLLLALPDELPMPDVGVDPDGDVSLTWFVSRGRMLSVSIGDSERIAFAWLNGSDSGHAVARFRPPALPAMFVDTLFLIVAHASPKLRAA